MVKLNDLWLRRYNDLRYAKCTQSMFRTGTFRSRTFSSLLNRCEAQELLSTVWCQKKLRSALNFSSLKLLSCEKDPAEIRLIWVRRGNSYKNQPVPHPVRPLKAIVCLKTNCQRRKHSSVSDLLFTIYSCWQRRFEQICDLFTMAQLKGGGMD